MNTQNESTSAATAIAAGPEQQTADEIDARAHVVDQEADRRLQQRRRHRESGEREPELRVGDVVICPDEEKQRRDQQHEIMAGEMRHAHAEDEPLLARARRRDWKFNGLRHLLLLALRASSDVGAAISVQVPPPLRAGHRRPSAAVLTATRTPM